MDLGLGMNVLTSSCSLGILCHAHFLWANARVDRVQKSPFYASLWQLIVQDRRLAVASNVGSVK